MKNISIEMLIFFCGIIISAENVEQTNPNYLIPPPPSQLLIAPAFHPFKTQKKNSTITTRVNRPTEEEEVDMNIEMVCETTRVTQKKGWDCLRCLSLFCCGRSNDE